MLHSYRATSMHSADYAAERCLSVRLSHAGTQHCRLISNLSFVSNSLEHVVAKQLTVHLESNGIVPALQSAYRRNHSTELMFTFTKCNMKTLLQQLWNVVLGLK